MPAAIAVPLITGAIAGGASVYGARSAGKAAKRASDVQSRSDDAALEFEREREAEARRQWDTDQLFKKAQFEASEEQRLFDRRLLEEREARRAPYRAASGAALSRLGDLLGLQFDASVPAPRGGTPPAGGMPPSVQPMPPRGPATEMAFAPVTGQNMGDLLQLQPRRRMA